MDPVRVDRWLWAARIFKTRALAAEAASGGRVDINGVRGKPGRTVQVGDRLDVSNGPVRMVLHVDALAVRRVSATEAAKLYTETDDSRERRAAFAAQRRLERATEPVRAAGRPTKRTRRRFEAEEEQRRRRAGEE